MYMLVFCSLLLIDSAMPQEDNSLEWLHDIINILHGYLRPLDNIFLPTVKPENIFLYIYTPQHRKRAQLLIDNFEIFNSQLSTKIIIPGWTEFANKRWVTNMTETYLDKNQSNIIVVDWEIYSRTYYNVACRQIESVGKVVINKLIPLMQLKGLNLQKVHIIGHSLGAHLAGYIGRTLRRITGKKVARITGLDAAGPFFDTIRFFQNKRLVATDAIFVDAIHTSSPVLGYYEIYGTVDFYVNGGRWQPGCTNFGPSMGILEILKFFHDVVACSHLRSHEYWTESIHSNGFKAQKSNDLNAVIMGENCSERTKGVYYLETNSKPPYARN